VSNNESERQMRTVMNKKCHEKIATNLSNKDDEKNVAKTVRRKQ